MLNFSSNYHKNKSTIKSYARKIGKNITSSKLNNLKNLLEKFKPENDKIEYLYKDDNKIIVEIGFGMGEHIIELLSENKNINLIAIEAYINGVYKLANIAHKIEYDNTNNLYIYNADADIIIDKLYASSIDIFYILFPDPWPKARHNKRRFLNIDRIKILISKLKKGGYINFVTDSKDYYDSVSSQLIDLAGIYFEVIKNFNQYSCTKYYNKAKSNDSNIFGLKIINV